MVEAHNYPYAEGLYGIPFGDLAVPFYGRIKGGSGREIICQISRSWITIRDEDENYWMQAVVKGNEARAIIATRKLTAGERHPDFFARKFFCFAFKHFEDSGLNVTKFVARWVKSEGDFGSLNWDQYKEGVAKGLSPQEAAKSTWTGKVLAECGFDEVEELHETVENPDVHPTYVVHVVFEK